MAQTETLWFSADCSLAFSHRQLAGISDCLVVYDSGWHRNLANNYCHLRYVKSVQSDN